MTSISRTLEALEEVLASLLIASLFLIGGAILLGVFIGLVVVSIEFTTRMLGV